MGENGTPPLQGVFHCRQHWINKVSVTIRYRLFITGKRGSVCSFNKMRIKNFICRTGESLSWLYGSTKTWYNLVLQQNDNTLSSFRLDEAIVRIWARTY